MARANRAARRKAALMPARTPERVAGYRAQWRGLAERALSMVGWPKFTDAEAEAAVRESTEAQHHWGHPFEGHENHACEPLTVMVRRMARAPLGVRLVLLDACEAAARAMIELLDAAARDAAVAAPATERAPDPPTEPAVDRWRDRADLR